MEIPKLSKTSGVPMAILFLTVVSQDPINQVLRYITHRENPPFIPSLFSDTFFVTTASSRLISHFRHSSTFPRGQQAHGLSSAIWQFKLNLSLSGRLYYGGRPSSRNTAELKAGMCQRTQMVWRFRRKSISKTPFPCEGKTTWNADFKGRQFTIF